MKNRVFIYGIFVVLFAGCCKAPVVDIQAEANAVRALEEAWPAAVQSKDVEKIMGYYASDAVHMPSGLPVVAGKDAIREWMQKLVADSVYQLETFGATVEAVEVSASGDLAFARGTKVISKKTSEGIVQEPGKWLDVWKKVDGEWKCKAAMGNAGH